MLNVGGITTENVVNVDQILANTNYIAISAIVDNTAKNDDGMCLAGTPLYGDFLKRDGGDNAFVKASVTGGTKGVWTVQITTAFVNDETITVNGSKYTKASTEDVESGAFAGSTAAEQVTSLLKMIVANGFDVAAVGGATDKIGFTQKVADASGSAPVVTADSSTGAIGSVTKVTDPVDGTSNANCVLMHDISFVGNSDANATVIIKGTLQIKHMYSSVQSMYIDAIVSALAANGINCVNPAVAAV